MEGSLYSRTLRPGNPLFCVLPVELEGSEHILVMLLLPLVALLLANVLWRTCATHVLTRLVYWSQNIKLRLVLSGTGTRCTQVRTSQNIMEEIRSSFRFGAPLWQQLSPLTLTKVLQPSKQTDPKALSAIAGLMNCHYADLSCSFCAASSVCSPPLSPGMRLFASRQ